MSTFSSELRDGVREDGRAPMRQAEHHSPPPVRLVAASALDLKLTRTVSVQKSSNVEIAEGGQIPRLSAVLDLAAPVELSPSSAAPEKNRPNRDLSSQADFQASRVISGVELKSRGCN